jgi:hypothetical protein
MRQLIHMLCMTGALGLGIVATETALAQSPKTLLITVVQQAPKNGGRAEVLVTAAPDSRNFVFVDAGASAADLEAAIDIARHLRFRFADTLSKDVRAVARPANHPRPAAGSARGKRLARFDEDLKHLAEKRPENVPGLGRVKSFDIVTTQYVPRTPR